MRAIRLDIIDLYSLSARIQTRHIGW